jgi:Mn2+/Fe2+ NRAMP family transporter
LSFFQEYALHKDSLWKLGFAKVFIGWFCFFGMHLIFGFPQSWFVLFFAFLLLWIVLLVNRRKRGMGREVKEQLYLAVAGLFALFLMEVFATTSKLWSYIPGNWPVILWPTYFVAILFGYQLLRFIEDLL